jgi:hypothetical protein
LKRYTNTTCSFPNLLLFAPHTAIPFDHVDLLSFFPS